MGGTHKQVFFDPKGIRARLFMLVSVFLTGTTLVLTFCLLGSIVAGPELTALNLQPPRRAVAASNVKPPAAGDAQVDPKHARQPDARAAQGARRYGFLVNWDENSFASLKRHADALDVLVGEWLHLDNAAGNVQMTHEHGTAPVVNWLRTHAPRLEIMPLVNNYRTSASAWDGAMVAEMVASPPAREQFASQLRDYTLRNGFAGAVIDLESIPVEAKAGFTALVQETAARFHADKLKLLVAVPPDSEAFDYTALAEAGDGLILMTYDQHSESGEPGPIAGQAWFESQLDARFKDIDGAKLIAGIASYGYDWSAAGSAKELSIQEVWDLLSESGAGMTFDGVSLNPTFSYRDDDDQQEHVVWYLDALTAYNHVAAALAMEPGGIALWRLGSEDPGIWPVLARERKSDEQVLEQLKTMQPGYDLRYKGEGEVLRVTGQERAGERAFEFDPASNLITGENISSFPSVTTITRWGARKDKVLALTFDDGPDPEYTPHILDILREKDVKAAFFVIGANGAGAPDLLRRIYNEGHDIGNHTFTHPNLSEVSPAQVDLEMNATQRLLEAKLGIKTALFRAPYARDMEPQTVDQAQALTYATNLGYTAIGLSIDPLDWMTPDADKIVESTLAQVAEARGNILLLHDSGGDRSHTIAALPRLIDALRGQGYSFVPVHELLRLERSAVMPAAQPDSPLMVKLNSVAFGAFGSFSPVLGFLFLSGIVLGTVRLLLVIWAALLQARRDRRRASLNWRPESLAVIVPAYNEEKVVCGSVAALLASTVKGFEIVVVDDGSSDGTYDVVRAAFAHEPRVRVFTKANGGKASALNFGLLQTRAEIVIALDADTVFEPEAVERLVRHFGDPHVGAVAGAAVVGNRINLLTRMQALEYITSQNLDRRALEMVNAITVVPGAIGAWRRAALIEAGGFQVNTLAEDADATIAIERAGWKVLTENAAIARTEAPETLAAFLKQRFRWMFGTLQVAYKHKGTMLRSEARGVAYFALPNIFVFQFLLALISPVMDLMLLLTLMGAVRAGLMHPADGLPPGLAATALYWSALQALEVLAAAIAFKLDGTRGCWRLLPLVIVQRFFYRQLIYWVAVRTALAAIKGRLVGWGKLNRTGQALAAMEAR
jgi:cellulose synthase/poly-beta-1,6-N-acetylglucosamine synthase-like glycosyltransferase/peptidoglycan/xylan/chitin deacetylase (PgdA/CDA1 family)/spore germination protein YaaH